MDVDQDLIVSRSRLRRLAHAQGGDSLESIAKNRAHWPPMTGVVEKRLANPRGARQRRPPDGRVQRKISTISTQAL